MIIQKEKGPGSHGIKEQTETGLQNVAQTLQIPIDGGTTIAVVRGLLLQQISEHALPGGTILTY